MVLGVMVMVVVEVESGAVVEAAILDDDQLGSLQLRKGHIHKPHNTCAATSASDATPVQ